MSVLVTTHYLDEAERCHRVALIHAGRLALIGSVAEVKGVFASRPVIEIRAERPLDAMRELDAMEAVEKTSLFGTALHAVLRSNRATPEEIGAYLRSRGLVVHSVERVQPSLEDVFLDVVDKAGSTAA